MKKYDFDMFVIGAGSGGVRAARMSAGLGAKVAIAEERYLGGTCVNVGCVPKKLFVYASHFAEDFNDAHGFGWETGTVSFSWQTLVKNKNAEIKRLNGIYQRLLDDAGVMLFNGRATVVDPHRVAVADKTYSAERILIATGSWPSIPDFPGDKHVISSNDAFYLETLPGRIMIIGGGYIAVEFAGIFNGLGVDTALIYRGPLFLRGFDGETREFLATEMQKKGIELLFNTSVTSIVNNGREFTAQLATGKELKADLIMYATGRKPNTANIGLEETDIKLTDKGAITVNDTYQTSIPSIYAIGDVTNRFNLTPVAITEGTALAKTLYGTQPEKVEYTNIPTCIFSQPNLGAVGLTEEQAREDYADIDVYKSSFTPMKHTLTKSDEKTFMKMIVDRNSDRVLGVHMVGADAGEIIQGIAIALRAGATKSHFDATIGIHPTAAEEFVTMQKPV
ncbi:MAG: glutathione-disulfide reductase [Gammaproteobacteria bacterium]